MKKFLALILTLAMALSVTACGGSDDTLRMMPPTARAPVRKRLRITPP